MLFESVLFLWIQTFSAEGGFQRRFGRDAQITMQTATQRT